MHGHSRGSANRSGPHRERTENERRERRTSVHVPQGRHTLLAKSNNQNPTCKPAYIVANYGVHTKNRQALSLCVRLHWL